MSLFGKYFIFKKDKNQIKTKLKINLKLKNTKKDGHHKKFKGTNFNLTSTG